MAEARRKALILFLELADLLTVGTVFAFTVLWSLGALPAAGWPDVLQLRISVLEALLVAAHLCAWHAALKGFGLYQSYRLAPTSRELRDLALAAAVAVGSLLAVLAVPGYEWATASFFVVYFAASLCVLGLERRFMRAIARRVRRAGWNIKNVVIVGADQEALDLSSELIKRDELGYRLLAVIAPETDGSLRGVAEQHDVLGRLDGIITHQQVDEVFVTVSLDDAHSFVRRVIARCEEQGVLVRVLADVAELGWGRATLDEVGGAPVVSVYSGPPLTIQHIVKRAIDLTVSAAGLILLAPVLAFVAVAIKASSSGPVFYVQDRVGQNRRKFRFFKFRTMVEDAPSRQAELEALNEADGPVFKIANDPRVTSVGRWLRRFSVDELPQLVNVLKGDMSLVGPRPLPVRDVEKIDVRWHNRRFSVKPGITCLWQVRARKPVFGEWVKADMEYIDNWSLALDLRILLATIPAVLSGAGAN